MSMTKLELASYMYKPLLCLLLIALCSTRDIDTLTISGEEFDDQVRW